jgi:hypothetical protein
MDGDGRMTMSDIRAQLAAVEKSTPGVMQAFAYPPDAAIGPLPAFINVMDSGEFTTPRMQGWREAVHVLKAKCLVQYQSDLESAERKVQQMVYDFTNELDQAKTLRGSERVIDADVLGYEAGTITLPNQEQSFVGVTFDVQVRELEVGVIYSSTG